LPLCCAPFGDCPRASIVGRAETHLFELIGHGEHRLLGVVHAIAHRHRNDALAFPVVVILQVAGIACLDGAEADKLWHRRMLLLRVAD
jgi:hypothetical protein